MKSNQWNLTSLFKSDTDPAIATYLKEQQQAFEKFIINWQKKNDYLTNSSQLYKALTEYETLQQNYGFENKAVYYFGLRQQLDQNNPQIKAALNKVEEQSIQLINQIQFFELNLTKIKPTQQKIVLKDPQLVSFRHFLKRLFDQSEHVLSDNEEKIMNLKSSPAYSDWVRMTTSLFAKEQRSVLDSNGKTKVANFSEIIGLIDHPKKKIRDKAAAAFNDILKTHLDVVEHEINAVLGNKKIDDQLRNYSRPDSSRHLHDDINSAVVDQLIQAVSKRNDIPQRFYKLKAKLLKLPKLAYHERNLSYGDISQQPYPFETAFQLVKKSLTQLDPEFGTILQQFYDQGQIDVTPCQGKASGAFCAHGLITHPVYVLLNHNDKLNDVLTLAHEFGHAINDEFMRQKQNSLNFGSPLSTAEVASTFMEDFVLQEVMQQSDDPQYQLSLLMMKLNDDISTIFRQIAFYQFEQELHSQFRQQGYLSASQIGQIFQKYMKQYMGSAVEQSARSENWWSYVSHFRSFFYVYSYASGLLISKSLQAKVKHDLTFIQSVKQFLSAGHSDSPQQIFLKLGIDISQPDFWQQGLDEIELLLKQAEKLAKKI